MTLREALSKSFSPEVWNAIEPRLSPPEILKMACLIEFTNNSNGPRIDFLRKNLIKLENGGYMSLNEVDSNEN